MKSISKKHINLGIIIVVLSVITLVLGIIKFPFFIFSSILLVSYIFLDKKELRCPNCGVFTNLDRLIYAKTHLYHCSNCGKRINILQ